MFRILRTIALIAPFVILSVAGAHGQDAKEEARHYYERGNTYYQQGKYNEAQEEYKKALDILSRKQRPLFNPQEAKKELTPQIPAARPSAVKEYIIGDDDVLHISVWQNPDLEQDAIVRPDGRISFPLIGDVQATGLTITQLDENITQKLKEYLKYPQVSISIKKLGGQKVMVLGEVQTQGVYAVTGAKTAIEAISLAGGFTRDAVPSSVVIIRGGFQNPEAKRINLSRALKGDLRQNIALQSEDILFVPKKFIANLNYFLSQILEPLSRGAYLSKEAMTY